MRKKYPVGRRPRSSIFFKKQRMRKTFVQKKGKQVRNGSNLKQYMGPHAAVSLREAAVTAHPQAHKPSSFRCQSTSPSSLAQNDMDRPVGQKHGWWIRQVFPAQPVRVSSSLDNGPHKTPRQPSPLRSLSAAGGPSVTARKPPPPASLLRPPSLLRP